MGSADWMPRNLDKRVEITFPVEDDRLKKKIIEILDIQLADTMKAHILQSDGSYEKQDLRGREKINSQDVFCEMAMQKEIDTEHVKSRRVFEPMMSPNDGKGKK